MPWFDDTYSPPKKTNLRERYFLNQAAKTRARQLRTIEYALQDPARRGLSPEEADLYRQKRDYLRDDDRRTRDAIDRVRQQNAASAQADEALKRLTPLQRSRRRDGLHRSSNDRNAAIAGILERERRRSAALTRRDWARAEAIAAARRSSDLKRAYHLSGTPLSQSPGAFVGEADIHDLRGVDMSTFDPCVEYKARQKVRKSVMFAQRSAGRGYRGRRYSRSPC